MIATDADLGQRPGTSPERPRQARHTEPVVDPGAVRKQLPDLRASDLERFPVWEQALDEEGFPGQDEETVKPRPDLVEVNPSEGSFIVRAEFIARDGSRFDGYAWPQLDSAFSVQPTLVTENGQVNLWYGSFVPEAQRLDKEYALLGKTRNELFPIRFRSVVPVRGVRLEGEVPGFMYLTDWQSGNLDAVGHVT